MSKKNNNLKNEQATENEKISLGGKIFLFFLACIIAYIFLLYPFTCLEKEILTCNANYKCTLEQKYVLYTKHKEIFLNKDSKINFQLRQYKNNRRAADYKTYKLYLTIIDKDNKAISPFKKELEFTMVDTFMATSTEIKQNDKTIEQEMSKITTKIGQDFTDYLDNPQKGFTISSSANKTDKFAMMPLYIAVFIFIGLLFLTNLLGILIDKLKNFKGLS